MHGRSDAGGELENVHLLRTVEQADALHAALAPGGRRVVVIGSGWIGMEVAATARTLGNDVTVLMRGEVPLASQLGAELGGDVARLHEENGVVLRAGVTLADETPYDAIPYFYTDQFDLGMEYTGFPQLAADADVVIRGDRDSRELIAFWLREGRVVAGMNVNVWDVADQVERLVRAGFGGHAVDGGRLADLRVPLEEL